MQARKEGIMETLGPRATQTHFSTTHCNVVYFSTTRCNTAHLTATILSATLTHRSTAYPHCSTTQTAFVEKRVVNTQQERGECAASTTLSRRWTHEIPVLDQSAHSSSRGIPALLSEMLAHTSAGELPSVYGKSVHWQQPWMTAQGQHSTDRFDTAASRNILADCEHGHFLVAIMRI